MDDKMQPLYNQINGNGSGSGSGSCIGNVHDFFASRLKIHYETGEQILINFAFHTKMRKKRAEWEKMLVSNSCGCWNLWFLFSIPGEW